MLDVSPLVRLAAVEAAGELRLASARTILFKVLEEEEEDEITSAAIWSLSQIGGEDVRLYIENLLDLAEEDEDVEFLEEALENVEFTDELITLICCPSILTKKSNKGGVTTQSVHYKPSQTYKSAKRPNINRPFV